MDPSNCRMVRYIQIDPFKNYLSDWPVLIIATYNEFQFPLEQTFSKHSFAKTYYVN